jgi:IS5 family transposase
VNLPPTEIWISDDVIDSWIQDGTNGQRGRPPVYTETAILCMATLEEVYHLPLRATEGLLRSIFQLMGVALPVPDYTTLSRRRRGLSVVLPRQRQDQAIHIVVDSTGMKVFGEGEWKVRQHGYSKRRTWRKLHLGVDEASGEIVAAVATTHDVADNEVIEGPLDQVEGEIEQVSGDGSYDKRNCYQAIKKRNAKAAIPPAGTPRSGSTATATRSG